MKASLPAFIICVLFSPVCLSQTIQWTKSFGMNNTGSQSEEVIDIECDDLGTVFALAKINSTYGVAIDTIDSVTGKGVLLKMDSTGLIQGLMTIGPVTSSNNVQVHSLELSSTGDIYLGLTARYSVTIGDSSLTLASNTRKFLFVKLDEDFNILWIRQHSEQQVATDTPIMNILEKPSGDVLLSFRFKQSLSFDSISLSNLTSSTFPRSAIIIQYSSDGLLQDYIVTYGGDCSINNLAMDDSANIYLNVGAGFFGIDSFRFDTLAIPAFYNGNVVVGVICKLDDSLNMVWSKIPDFQGHYNFLNAGIELSEEDVYLFYNALPSSGTNTSITVTLDSLVDSTSFSNYARRPIILKLTLDGTPQSVYVAPQEFGNSGFLTTTTYQDRIIAVCNFKSQIGLNGFIRNPGNGSLYGAFLELDPSTDAFDVYYIQQSQYNFKNINTVKANGHNVYFGGFINNVNVFGNDTLFPTGVNDAFMARIYDCYHIGPSISGNLQSCGVSTPLTANPQGSQYQYQWLFSNSQIANATSEVYNAGVSGSYRVLISDSSCGDTSSSYSVNVVNVLASLNLSVDTTCVSSSAFSLSGGTPAGGMYFGNGVSSGIFDPSASGSGSALIYYAFEDTVSGCADTAFDFIYVSGNANAVFFQNFTTACVGDSITLTTGYPSGGTYSGPGVSGNHFTPSSLDTGYIDLVYTISNGGCEDADTIQVYVAPTPTVSLNLATNVTCEVVSFVTLSGQSPAGGTFTGTAVTGNFFIPTVAGVGSFPITYSVTSGGCTGTAVDTITVDSFPAVSLPLLDSICEGSPVFTFDHGYPQGGDYTGTGITSNTFNASAAGTGSTPVMYVFENSCAADTAYSTINVISDPTLSASVGAVSCNGGNDGQVLVNVSGGNFPYSFTWSNGDSTSTITNLVADTYGVTVTGEGGCNASGSFSVSEPGILTINLDSLTDVVCNGFSNGEAFISVSGGTSPYSYAWSTGATSEDVGGLGAGTFIINVTDANGCSDSLPITISEVTPVSVSTTLTDITCYGASDGAVSSSVSGGGGIYSYAWSTGAMTQNLSSLDSGSYVLTVTDQNGCTGVDTAYIAEPDSISIILSTSNPQCYGYTNGSVASSASGGTGAYSFAWSTSSALDSISGLSSGTYTLTVTDANGCSNSASSTLSNPDSISISISESQSISCFGLNDGALQANASNGVGSYGYAWSNGGSISIIDSLPATTYTVTVTDGIGCSNTTTYILNEPSALVLSIDSVVEPLCDGDSAGYLGASATGGTGTISFLWNTGTTTSTISSLDSGSYSLTVTDDNGCASDTALLLDDPEPITVSLSTTPVSCFGDSNGSISVSITNAVGSTSYFWSNGATTANLDSVSGGLFSLTVTDDNGCLGVGSVSVFEPSAVSITGMTIEQNICNGDSTASISLSGQGSWGAPFSYIWSTGDTTSTLDSLPEGNYGITVSDTNGCSFDTTFIVTDPAPITLTLDSLWMPLCFGDSNGYAAFSAGGGNSQYSWIWSDSSTQSVRNDLIAATYSVTLLDGPNGECTLDTSLTITTPAALEVSVDSLAEILCNGDSTGAIQVSASGGVTPYTYAWSNGDTSYLNVGLVAGSYVLTLTDENGCTSELNSIIVQPDSIEVVPLIENTLCSNESNGLITLQVLGGTEPFTFQWSNGVTSFDNPNLSVGTYAVTITDSNQCTKEMSLEIVANEEAPLVDLGSDTGYCAGDSMTLTATDEGLWIWSTGENTESIIVSAPGTYALTIESSLCSASDTIEVSEYPLPVVALGNDTMMCIADLEEGLSLNGPSGMAHYTWSTGGTDSIETITTFGWYWLVVENGFGCLGSDSIAVMGDTCLGVDDISASTWNVFPNPTRGRFTITSGEASSRLSQIKIYNYAGQLMMEDAFRGSRTDVQVSGLAAGVYHLEVRSNGFYEAWRTKVVVQ